MVLQQPREIQRVLVCVLGRSKFYWLTSFAFFERNDNLCPANHFLGYSSFGNEEMSEEIKTKVNAIKQQYFGGDVETFDDRVFKSLSNVFTDSGFHIGSDIMVRYVVELK